MKLPLLLFLLFIFGCSKSKTTTLGGTYSINDEGLYSYISAGNIYQKGSIPATIEEYKYDSTFIVAKQKTNQTIYKYFLGSQLYSRYVLYHSLLQDSNALKRGMPPFVMEGIKKDRWLYELLKAKKVSFEESISDVLTADEVADSILSNDSSYKKIFRRSRNYWIVDKRKKTLFGPYDFDSFNSSRDSLGVKLTLQE